MNWDDFWKAFGAAKCTMSQADTIAENMASILVGRLNKCSGYTLEKLKRELRDFNIQTHQWKDGT